MADRGRDLKVSILSDADKFDVDEPARDLERLADAADDTGRKLGDLDDKLDDSGRRMRDLGEDTVKGERALDDVGDQARTTAAKVDDAFEKIARSSKQNLRNRLDDDADKAKRSLGDIRDEANDTAREMGASFGGTTDDIADGFQELAANALSGFGPLGMAAGAAAAVGVGLIRAEQEKLKELTAEMVEDMIESGGKLSDAFIDTKLQEMASDGTLIKLQEQAQQLGVSYEDLARAKAGDAEASERVLEQATELSQRLSDQAAASGSASGETYALQTALNQLVGELSTTVKASNLAERASSAYAKAAKSAGKEAQNAAHVTGASWDDLRSNLGRTIRARVDVDAPSPGQLRQIRTDMLQGIGTIVVPVRAGQSRFTNTSSNSRYRE